jgi:heparin/heparan-sulfate lyase
MRTFVYALACLVASSAAAQPLAPPTPPSEHPRLYIRAQDLPLIRQRLNHPLMAPVWKKVQAAAHAKPEGLNQTEMTRWIAAKALVRLLDNDPASGRDAIETLRTVLPAADFDLKAQDISRQIGALMLSTAFVYDWCYPQLTADDKSLFITHLGRLARMLETGYPPTRGGNITGHAGEAMLLRDTLGAGIAIYDENPEMYRLASRRIFAEQIPARNFFYPAASHHQGSAYGPYRFSWEMLFEWMMKRMTGGQDYFVKDQSQVPYRWVYSRRPDGRLLADGDVFGSGSTTRADMLTASYYGDSALDYFFVNAKDFARTEPIEQILFWDPNLEPKEPSLPLARFFGFPLSATIARTSWDANAAIVEMKMQDYQFNNHQHLDAGSFQIFYRGPLAIDSGLYATYGTDHDTNYLKRTIAHNAMLVFDPEEKFRRGQAANDGGQRWPANGSEPVTLDALLNNGYQIAKVTRQETSADTSTLEGDLSKAYSDKVVSYRRGFVYVNLHDPKRPAALVVYDHITTAKPEFKKTWLLHSIDEPQAKDAITVIRQNGGKLVNQTLEPKEFQIVKVGGPGHEFEFGGQNHPPNRPPKPEDEAGSWRIELSPAKPVASDDFLNVIQIMDDGVDPLPVTRTKEGIRIGSRTIALPNPR